jgi:hypothetical protein
MGNDRDILENIYHRGQDNIWNGKKLLRSLIDQHGVPNIDAQQKKSLGNIFAIILAGERVAWNVSSQLSYMIDDQGAKMAAVSQAHDEARHFYVIKDYLELLGYEPKELSKSATYVLDQVVNTTDLARKLLGMQLMIEPIALTIFRFVRKSNVDPVLSGILEYFEIDESRHVALGIKYLPLLIKKMNTPKLASFLVWQARMINAEINGLRDLEEDLLNLGLNPLEIFEYAEKKQVECLKLVANEMGVGESIWNPILKLVQFKKKLAFYPNKQDNFIKKVTRSLLDVMKST